MLHQKTALSGFSCLKNAKTRYSQQVFWVNMRAENKLKKLFRVRLKNEELAMILPWTSSSPCLDDCCKTLSYIKLQYKVHFVKVKNMFVFTFSEKAVCPWQQCWRSTAPLFTLVLRYLDFSRIFGSSCSFGWNFLKLQSSHKLKQTCSPIFFPSKTSIHLIRISECSSREVH